MPLLFLKPAKKSEPTSSLKKSNKLKLDGSSLTSLPAITSRQTEQFPEIHDPCVNTFKGNFCLSKPFVSFAA